MNDFIYGDYFYPIESRHLENNLKIVVQSNDLIHYWKKCGYIANFISLYNSNLTDANLSCSEKKVYFALSTIFNELLENAIKYSTSKNGNVSIDISNSKNVIIINIENGTSRYLFENYMEVSKNIFTANKDKISSLFFEKLEKNANEQNNSGIGLLMLLNDYPVKIGTRFQEKNEGLKVTTRLFFFIDEIVYGN